jgi:hypothetical protein
MLEMPMLEMKAKLEKIFVERALPVSEIEGMTLGKLLYHALMECGEGCELIAA